MSTPSPSPPTQPPVPTKVSATLKTDVGMVREHNEDSAYMDPKGSYFIVADGMGGHAAGEVASSMAVEEVAKALEAARPLLEKFAAEPADEGRQQVVQILEDAVRRAHQAVYERGGRETDKRGMGTTLDVLLVVDGEAFVAHVGDSRTYLLRGGSAAQVTTDHTVAEVLVIEGKLSADEARISPLRTILVNAIGVSADVGVELAHLKLRKGDVLLLCSDGLHDYYPSEGELAEVIGKSGPAEALGQLVQTAKDRGGHDNITGIAVEVVEGQVATEAETQQVAGPTQPIRQRQDDVATRKMSPVVVPEDDAASEFGAAPTQPNSDMKAKGDDKKPAKGDKADKKAAAADKTDDQKLGDEKKPAVDKKSAKPDA